MFTTNDPTTEIKELEKVNAEHTAKIKDLENKLTCRHDKEKANADKIKEQSAEIEKLQEKNGAKDKEIIQLKASLKDLEQRLYPSGRMIFTILSEISLNGYRSAACGRKWQVHTLSNCSLN